MTRLNSGDFSIHINCLDVGGWFVDELLWAGRVITQAGASDFAAGWELSLGTERYTPHTGNLVMEAIESVGSEAVPERVLPHRTADGLARICHHLRIIDGALEQWVEVENLSSEALVIRNLNFSQVKLDPSFQDGMEVWHQYAQALSPVVDNYLELHDPAVLLHKPAQGWGVAVINLAPAQTHRISTGTYTSVGYSNGAAPFEWHLAAGEVFESDRAVVLPYFGDGQSAIYDYTRAVLRGGKALKQDLTYCSWEPFGRDIDEGRILEQVDQASELGFETFVIDDGWQLHGGDWEPDLAKFPQGLQPIRDRLKERGMQLGLWVGFATVNEYSKTYKEYEDCILCDESGEKKMTHVFEGAMGIGCLASRFAAYLEGKLHGLIAELDLRYIKLDLPVAYDVYHKPALLCHATDHGHAPGRDYTLKSYRAVQEMARRLKAAFPQLVIDLTFELWGGWHAVDPALVACADVTWLSNLSDAAGTGNYGPAQARHLAASRSRIVPPEHLVVGNLRCNGSHPAESVASVFASYPMLLGNLSELSEAERETQQALLAWFKQVRDRSDITEHFATVLEAGQTFVSEHAYSGFLRTDKGGNGMLGVFRNVSKSRDAVLVIDLPSGVADITTVRLTDASTGESQEVTAANLRAGLTVRLAAPHAFQLFTVERLASLAV